MTADGIRQRISEIVDADSTSVRSLVIAGYEIALQLAIMNEREDRMLVLRPPSTAEERKKELQQITAILRAGGIPIPDFIAGTDAQPAQSAPAPVAQISQEEIDGNDSKPANPRPRPRGRH
ncbi:MAG TPA: hypothetical protein VFA71_03980 [Terriglobales bacterium]|nr:hypothetical protein [Terriglobales bacterium]